MPSTRLEAFSDGVIAVVATIMVLELHVPRLDGWPGFVTMLPLLAIYALSFVMVGIYWINHHELLRRCEQIGPGVLWANLLFLFTLSFLPFATDYVGEKHFDAFSAMLYTGALLLAAVAFFGLRRSVVHIQSRSETLPRKHRLEGRAHLASLVLYGVAFPIAVKVPLASFGLDTLVTLLWILPAFGNRDVTRNAA